MAEVPIEALQEAIRNLHGCASIWTEAIPVKETFEGQTVWEAVVQVFDLIGHSTAKRAYAWSHEANEGMRRIAAVLHQGPVDSPLAAVRAAIVAIAQEQGEIES